MKSSPFQNKLIALLAEGNFPNRYYSYVARANRDQDGKCSYETFCRLLQADSRFKHVKSERFFEIKESVGKWNFKFKLAYAYSRLELILYVNNGTSKGGAPVTLLAREAGLLLDPEFEPKPAAPKIPLGNEKQSQDAFAFALSFYEDIREKILQCQEWPEGK